MSLVSRLKTVTRCIPPGFMLLLIVTGCSVTQPEPVHPEKVETTETEDVVVPRLLAEAGIAFEDDRLTTPREESAYQRYLDVLALDPSNQEARLGINRIIEQYLSWALSQADLGHYSRARTYVARAQDIDGVHPNIGPVLKSIAEKENAVETRFELDPDDVADRRVSKLMLRHIARRITAETTFVTIQAPDDASGRWLYQQLNNRVDFRIPARFKPAGLPAIVLSR